MQESGVNTNEKEYNQTPCAYWSGIGSVDGGGVYMEISDSVYTGGTGGNGSDLCRGVSVEQNDNWISFDPSVVLGTSVIFIREHWSRQKHMRRWP